MTPHQVLILGRFWRELAIENASYNLYPRRLGPPDLLWDQVVAALPTIALAPEAGTKLPKYRRQGGHRVLLKKIRYHVYYFVDSQARIVVLLSFWHASRRPPKL